MSDDPQTPPPAPYPQSYPTGGYTQPAPGAAPVPTGAPEPYPGTPAPYGAPVPYGAAPYGAPAPYPGTAAPYPGSVAPYPGAAGYPDGPNAPQPAPARSRTLGVAALVVAIAAVLISVILSATTGFAAAEGAMRHAIGLSPEGLENLSEDQLLALLSPVRGLVLWAEIGFWLGTALGLVALALGITAIATRRGRGFGVAAVVVAAVGPFLYGITVGAFVVAGIAAGAS